jgi:hypothetical protein
LTSNCDSKKKICLRRDENFRILKTSGKKMTLEAVPQQEFQNVSDSGNIVELCA